MMVMGVLSLGGHPKLYVTPADVARGKVNVGRFAWAGAYLESARKDADKWASMTDERIRAVVPPVGSVFAYGFSGCPACGTGWPTWGAGGMASLDKPGVVVCPGCKRTFPDAEHPDAGTGWRDPKSGKIYYLVGCYNAYAAQEITLHALRSLSFCYAMTGEAKYSHAAAVLYDKLADLYPTSIVGSSDYPDGAHNTGRLERPQYQVARVLVFLADYLDLLYDSPEFAAPSASGKGSVREHVEQSVIRDGGKYCYDMAVTGRMGLTNGQADYVRGALAAGIILDEKDWIECAISGPYCIYSFLDNCLDRDGQYYETSIGYSEHGLLLYNDMAEMLYNLRTPAHPTGIDLYSHPKLRKAFFEAFFDIDCLGHLPRFGDWGPDLGVVTTDKRFAPMPYILSEFLCARAENDADRDYWAAARESACDGDVEARRASSGWKYWLTMHAEPIAKSKAKLEFEPHAVLGGRGIVTLRSGVGATGRAALLRYGPSLNHGHLDDLNVNYYGLGRELTYDLGYSLGSAHVQVGWAKATASHNLVVVNERNQLLSPGGGGSAYFCVDRAPVRATEASSEASYASEGVKTYRRTLAMIDAPGGSYLVDIFRVAGGTQHDLMWHFAGTLGNVTGAGLGPAQEKGSLAGPDYDWGKRVGPAGYLIGCADQPEYWNPPPGNGYGFLCDVRRAERVEPECAATWAVGSDGKQSVTLRLLPEPGSELVTARGPGILPTSPVADYAILRRSMLGRDFKSRPNIADSPNSGDLSSAFISVVEPSEGGGAVVSAKRLDVDGAVGVRIETSAGVDYVLSSVEPRAVVFDTPDGKIGFDGRFGFLRVAQKASGRKASPEASGVERGVLVGGTKLAMGSYEIRSARAAFSGKVTEIDYKRAEITLDASGRKASPEASEASEAIVYLSRDGYSHSSPYRVKAVEGKVVTLDGDMAIGRGQVGDAKPTAPDAIANVVPLPRATVVGRKQSGYFRGKLIVNDGTGARSTVIDVDADQRTVHVTDPAGFAAGDSFTVYDAQVGDTVTVPCVVER